MIDFLKFRILISFSLIFRWFRRGWITFERDVKIKEICYSLNNIRLRDFELGPIVNRDLSRRIRPVNGITVDRKVVRNDIKLAGKLNTIGLDLLKSKFETNLI